VTRQTDNIIVASTPKILINNTVSNRRHKTEIYSTHQYHTSRSRERSPSPERAIREHEHFSRRSRLKPIVVQSKPTRISRSNTLPAITMCEKHYYYKDGRRVDSQVEQCSKAARHGPNAQCEEPVKFRHPDGEAPRRSSQYLSPGFPPSPPSSDTSFAPSSDGERSHKRRSGTYINGEKIGRSNSRREKRSSAHVTFAEPSTSYDTPSSSPSRSPTYTYHSSTSPSYTSHDQSHYSRPEVRLEVNRPRRNSTVQYEQIPKSKAYSVSSSSEEERLRQKLKREEKKNEEAKRQIAEAKRQAEEAERRAEAERKSRKEVERERKLENEIKRQNATIESRPPIVQAATPYRRGSVSIKQSNTADPYVSRSSYNYSVQQDPERRRRKEEEAQQARLRARLNSHSSYDRPTVVYQSRDPYM
jgi:hypothetical protein